VSVNQEKVTDPQVKLALVDGMLLQVGKRKAARVEL